MHTSGLWLSTRTPLTSRNKWYYASSDLSGASVCTGQLATLQCSAATVTASPQGYLTHREMQPLRGRTRSLASSRTLLARIIDHIHDVVTWSALALASRNLHHAARRRIYSDITIPDGDVNGDRQAASIRRKLLIRTLSENPHLGGLVRRVSTGLAPTAEVVRLLAACPHMTSLRWQIINVPLAKIGTSWYIHNSLPDVSASIDTFTLQQRVPSSFWPGSLERALSASTQISSLSLHATVETVEVLLRLCGANLRKLALWVWDSPQSMPSTPQLQDWFLKIPQVEQLHLYAMRPSQLHVLNMLTNLKRLSFENVTYSVVCKILRKIAQGSAWCPSLVSLPRFKHIANTNYLFTRRGRSRWRLFKNTCKLAKMNLSRREAWKGSAMEAQDLLERIRRGDQREPVG